MSKMADSEIRRSGRQRTVSSRLKDMDVSIANPKANKPNADSVSDQHESPKVEAKKRGRSQRERPQNNGKKMKIVPDNEVVVRRKSKQAPVPSETKFNKDSTSEEMPKSDRLAKSQMKTKHQTNKDIASSSNDTDSYQKVPSTDVTKNIFMTEDASESDPSSPGNSAVAGAPKSYEHESPEIEADEANVTRNKSKPENVKSKEGEEPTLCPNVKMESATQQPENIIPRRDKKETAPPENKLLPQQNQKQNPTELTRERASQTTQLKSQNSNNNNMEDDYTSEAKSSGESTNEDAAKDKEEELHLNDLTDLSQVTFTVTQNEKGELLLSHDGTEVEEDSPKFPDDSPSSLVLAMSPTVTEHGWACNVKDCYYLTSKRANWYKHQRLHTGTRIYPCDKCPYVAKTSSNLKRHQMIHTNFKQFTCNICEDTFRQKIHLQRHMKYKHESKRIQCAYCDYRCANVNPDLRIHMKRRHLLHINEAAARVLCSCEVCGFVAPSKKDLSQHMKFHRSGPELKLFCEYCSFVTDCSSRLTRHLLIHTRERPYQCGLCDYRGSQKQHVIRHMRKKHQIEPDISIKSKAVSVESELLQTTELSESMENADESDVASSSLTNDQNNTTDNQNMEMSNALQLDVPGTLIHPTSDIIRDGFRVLMDEPDDKLVAEEKSCENENASANEISVGDGDHVSYTTMYANLANVTNHNQGKSGRTEKDQDNSAIGGQTEENRDKCEEKKKAISPMVGLFQPSDLGTDKIFPCLKCPMKFSKLLNLHKHLALQHKEVNAMQSVSCCWCNYKTDKKTNLLIHMRKHNMPRKNPHSLLLDQKQGRGLLYGSAPQQKSLIKQKRVYNCILCQYKDIDLQPIFKHIQQEHQDILHRSGGQDPGTFCVVNDEPSLPDKVDTSSSKNVDSGYQRVMVEMWPGSPAQPVEIEPPWHQQETNNSQEMIEGLQALADQASSSNALSAKEIKAVCNPSEEKDNIQVSAEQLMSLSSGDYIEIDGEMYKVEFSN